MNILSAQNLGRRHGNQTLFADLTIGLNAGEKLGIIGRNGQGKSTLARILAGLEEPDSGQVVHKKGLKIAYMEQNPEARSDLTIQQYIRPGGESLPVGQVREVLSLVGIEAEDKPLSMLSGGGLRRASLARALLSEADLLILDEPTNHLDLDAILSLEDRLRRFSGALLLITHDRYFLDRIVGSILEVDQGSVRRFEGGYSSFLEKKEALEQQARLAEHKAKKFLSTELEWLRRQPKARGTKQRARIDRIEKVQSRDKYSEQKQMKLAGKSARLGNKILEIHDLAASVEDKALFSEFEYRFQSGDRVGILGPNGCGKSTLLDTIANRRSPDHGRIEYGETVRIGYFDQMGRIMPDDMRVEDFFKQEVGHHTIGTGLSPGELLEAFLFHPSVLYRPLGKLSGGEKRRVLLVSVLLNSPNFLILDEPTNDFDISTLTALESYLDDFPGPVVTVSHDRWFLDRVASHLFLFRPDGKIQDYVGSASDFLEDRRDSEWLQENNWSARGDADRERPAGAVLLAKSNQGTTNGEGDKLATNATSARPVPARRMGNKERKELAELPGRIESLEKEIAELESKLSSGESDSGKLATWGARHVEANTELEQAMERWVELEEIQRSHTL